MDRTYHWMGRVLDEMIQFAEWNELVHVAGVLARAKSRIRDHLEVPAQPEDYAVEERSLREVLDEIISYCRLHQMDEVVDHLMEAQMAWLETHPAFGDNVVLFPTIHQNRGNTDPD